MYVILLKSKVIILLKSKVVILLKSKVIILKSEDYFWLSFNMKIIGPTDNQVYNVNSSKGKNILKQYIKFYQSGGHFVEVNKEMLTNMNTFGRQSCAANAFNWMGYSVFQYIFLALKAAGQSITLKKPATKYTHNVLNMFSILKAVSMIEDAIRQVDESIINKSYKRIKKDTKIPPYFEDFIVMGDYDLAVNVVNDIKKLFRQDTQLF